MPCPRILLNFRFPIMDARKSNSRAIRHGLSRNLCYLHSICSFFILALSFATMLSLILHSEKFHCSRLSLLILSTILTSELFCNVTSTFLVTENRSSPRELTPNFIVIGILWGISWLNHVRYILRYILIQPHNICKKYVS